LLRSTPRLDVVLDRLVAIPGAPPDLRQPPAGCAFAARCEHAAAQCRAAQPALEPLPGSEDRLVACFRAAALRDEARRAGTPAAVVP
jgi:oligopeptide/dipeptide ABC transporter ATP-binding protein